MKKDIYRTNKKRMSFKKRLGIKFIALGFIIVGMFIIADMRIRPLIEKNSVYQCQILAVRIINEVMYNELQKNQYDYNSLVKLSTDENGRIVSVESNMHNINQLKSYSSLMINEAIQEIPTYELGIALGTVSGINMLYGAGPVIPIKLAPRGYANTVLVSKFSSAGINQTLHQIIMKITVDITAIIPGYTKTVIIDIDFIIAETVIIGSVPSSYTHIISGNSDLINEISDYGAESYAENDT